MPSGRQVTIKNLIPIKSIFKRSGRTLVWDRTKAQCGTLLSPSAPQTGYTQWRLLILHQSPRVVRRGEESRFWCHLKQIQASFLSLGASYWENTVGAGSRAVFAGGASRCCQAAVLSLLRKLPLPTCPPPPPVCFGSTGITGKLALTPGSSCSRSPPNIFPARGCCWLPAPPPRQARPAGSPPGHPLATTPSGRRTRHKCEAPHTSDPRNPLEATERRLCPSQRGHAAESKRLGTELRGGSGVAGGWTGTKL